MIIQIFRIVLKSRKYLLNTASIFFLNEKSLNLFLSEIFNELLMKLIKSHFPDVFRDRNASLNFPKMRIYFPPILEHFASQGLFPLHPTLFRAVVISSRLTDALKSFQTNYPCGRKKRRPADGGELFVLCDDLGETRTGGETKVRIKDPACRLRDNWFDDPETGDSSTVVKSVVRSITMKCIFVLK